MIVAKKIISCVAAFSLISCSNLISEDKNARALDNLEIVVQKKNPELNVFTSEQCFEPDSGDASEKESAFGSILLGSLAKSVIVEGFNAINDYATKKATADSNGTTFTGFNNSYLYKGSLKNSDGNLNLETKMYSRCITIIKQSNVESNGKWASEIGSKLNIGSEVAKILSKKDIENTPEFIFQVNINFLEEFGVYEVKPVLLNLISPLGKGDSKTNKDLAIVLEFFDPSVKDTPALQMKYNFKEVKASHLYTLSSLKNYHTTFYPMINYKNSIHDTFIQVKSINGSTETKNQFIEKMNFKYNKQCETVAQKNNESCMGMLAQIGEAEYDLKVIDQQKILLERKFGSEYKLSNPVNIKASVTEVGDVNKFWSLVAEFTGGLKDPVESYAKEKYSEITDTTTESDKITESNIDIGYLISIANFDIANKALNDASDDKKMARYVDCLNALKLLKEAAIKAEQIATQTCDL